MRFLSLPTALLISLALAYALLLPESQKAAVPLLPALRSYWRWIHVPPLLVSYAFFGLAGFASIAYLVRKRDHYQEAIYRCVAMGFPLLTFGIVTGAIWANESWGNLWQWDPKENLALVTWFFYAAYLHLKLSDRASGKALAWLILVGAVATYMTYIGINQFDLGGLHTYGKV
jgi:ABC-type transport system involved in cytochrome c biogenesis permease subunit